MDKLLLHSTTDYQLHAATESLPHAVLISGNPGAGKRTMARTLAAQALKVTDARTQPYFLEVIPEKDSISIAEVRAIKDFLSKKTTGDAALRRVLLIPNAHTMGVEAQNALLKTLEEPPADTMIILTASDITGLKPTIRSRSQHIIALPVSLEQATAYFTSVSADEVRKAYHISDGQPGLLNALLQNQTDHPVVQAIEQAKNILKASKFERLAMVDELGKQKDQLKDVLNGLQQVIRSALHQATSTENKPQAKRFYVISTHILKAQEQLAKNVNPKLLLTNLFLEM
jgi:DNA polymerase-3 subunit delta'